MNDPYRYFDGAKFKVTNDKNWGDVYYRYLARGHDHGSAAYAADMWEKRHCTRCGAPLNDEVALVNGEEWCHSCADGEKDEHRN